MEFDDKNIWVAETPSAMVPATPAADDRLMKKRKRPEGQRCFETLMRDTFSIDLIISPLSPEEISEGYTYCLRSRMTVKKSDQAKQAKRKCTKTASGLVKAPMQELVSASLNKETGLNKKKPSKIGKFRPKVMIDSPCTKTPKPATPISSVACSRRRSCRRGLDFDSHEERINSTLQSIDGSSEIDSNKSKTLLVYTRSGDRFTRRIRKKGLVLKRNDVEEDKWWENEKELFRQKAISFITSTRLMQGNRPFMGWRGSVVDSIVGVFLSQNVSDNYSSSAFMSLAAKYPKKTVNRDQINDKCTEHALDWNAVRCAKVDEISHAIKDRGMSNRIAERIQMFLAELYKKSEHLDLEWLRKAKPEEAKDFLSSIYGLGLKSMECLRLLTLRQHAFPVDRHVGRIVVRLGWVPIEKLPDGVLIHSLEEYPVLKSIQEYLSKRLCNLDADTLYELHSQMITFGKVFCTKKKPNCSSCPMKIECKYYASTYESIRLSLINGLASDKSMDLHTAEINRSRRGRLGSKYKRSSVNVLSFGRKGQNILEEDIEDLFHGPEIPAVIAKTEAIVSNLWNYMAKKNRPLEKDEASKALVSVTSEEAYIPTHKPRNAVQLRTEHQVYVLPDSHPLLQQLDKRDCDDKYCYLLAIWPPDATESCFKSKVPHDECSSSSDLQEKKSVLGTLLIPCRTATRGLFPLDGTFFQINEVFADDETSQTPIDVPQELLSNLRTRTLYCGTSISAISGGMSAQEIQECFCEGIVCIRGFNTETRAPKPLAERLHCSPSKTVKRGNTNPKVKSTRPAKDVRSNM